MGGQPATECARTISLNSRFHDNVKSRCACQLSFDSPNSFSTLLHTALCPQRLTISLMSLHSSVYLGLANGKCWQDMKRREESSGIFFFSLLPVGSPCAGKIPQPNITVPLHLLSLCDNIFPGSSCCFLSCYC